MKILHGVILCVTCSVLLFTSGCAPAQQSQASEDLREIRSRIGAEQPIPACAVTVDGKTASDVHTIGNVEYCSPSTVQCKGYVLQPGDSIAVKFFYNPELNEELRIRPDGMISLQLIGEVQASELTPAELRTSLEEKYAKFVRKPEATVIVRETVGRNIYVGGEVQLPQSIPYLGRTTALQAIFKAGGTKDTAELKNVVVLRYQGNDKPVFMKVNLKEDLKHGTNNDVLLQPYDIVYVPKSMIASMDLWVEQNINMLVPFSKNVGVSYIFGPGVGSSGATK